MKKPLTEMGRTREAGDGWNVRIIFVNITPKKRNLWVNNRWINTRIAETDILFLLFACRETWFRIHTSDNIRGLWKTKILTRSVDILTRNTATGDLGRGLRTSSKDLHTETRYSRWLKALLTLRVGSWRICDDIQRRWRVQGIKGNTEKLAVVSGNACSHSSEDLYGCGGAPETKITPLPAAQSGFVTDLRHNKADFRVFFPSESSRRQRVRERWASPSEVIQELGYERHWGMWCLLSRKHRILCQTNVGGTDDQLLQEVDKIINPTQVFDIIYSYIYSYMIYSCSFSLEIIFIYSYSYITDSYSFSLQITR